ncbi:MAG: ATP-binding protein [Bacteroidetes bacterium]|nr:ATP-binding protein [Bacteroidota bacterium]
MIISIASGKGGTGKTTVAVNLALSLSSAYVGTIQIIDCDVEEPNAHIFLKPHITKTLPISIPVPRVIEKRCTYCGKCQEVCVYNAIAVIKNSTQNDPLTDSQTSAPGGKVLIFPELCHSCGGCSLFCPEKAIEEVGREIGIIQIGTAGNIEFVDGKLNIGEAMSPPLIRAVKKNITNNKVVIIDAPPGTSCPVIGSIKGSDYCILVTEPTPFGMNDLILAVEVIRKLNIAFGVVINRTDIPTASGQTGYQEVENYCSKENIPVLMRIPFDRKIAESYSKGIPMVEFIPEYITKFIQLFNNIKKSNHK